MGWTIENPTLKAATVQGGGSISAISLVTDVTITAGSWVFLLVRWNSTSGVITSVNDNGPGLTWQFAQQNSGTLSTEARAALVYAYAPAGIASGRSITVSFSAITQSYSFMQGCSWKGGDAGAVVGVKTWLLYSTWPYITTPITTPKTNTLVLAAMGIMGNAGAAPHAPGIGSTELLETSATTAAYGGVLAYRTDGVGYINGTFTNTMNSYGIFGASIALEATDSVVNGSGFKHPTSHSNDTLASTTWSNQENILIEDDTEVTEAIIAKNTPATGSTSTGWLKAGGFGLSIPAGVVITKVEIIVRWRMNSSSGVGNRDICWAVGGTRGTNTHTSTVERLQVETDKFDVTSERAWTVADFSTFEIHVRGRNGNNATDPSYRFMWVKVDVTYEFPPEPIWEMPYDDFNRADGPVYDGVGANYWRTHRLDWTDATLARVIDNRLGSAQAGYQQAVSQHQHTGNDWDLLADCAVTGATPFEIAVWFNAENIGADAATLKGYVFIGSSSSAYWAIRRYAAGVNQGVIAGPNAFSALVAGDTLWIAKRENTYSIYRRPSGGAFSKMVEVTDTNNTGGVFCFEISDTTIRWDNVRGGPFVPPVYPKVVSVI